MRVETVTTAAEATRRYRDFTRGALAVRASYIALGRARAGGPLFTHPVFVVDAGKRPDVADLARVHATEGDGQLVASWHMLVPQGDIRPLARLDVVLRRPVSCRFAVLVDVLRHREALSVAAATGYVGLATRRPRQQGGNLAPGAVLALEAPGADLRSMLALLEVRP